MTGCIIRVTVSDLMAAHHGAHYGNQGHQGGQKWGTRSSPQRSWASPQRSWRSAPSSQTVAVQAGPRVCSIGVQAELKKVVVRVIQFSDRSETYNQRLFCEGFLTWRLRRPSRRRGGRQVQRAFAVLRAARAGWCNQWAACGRGGIGPDGAPQGPAWGAS